MTTQRALARRASEGKRSTPWAGLRRGSHKRTDRFTEQADQDEQYASNIHQFLLKGADTTAKIVVPAQRADS
jgi:hypothetical protein